MEKCNIQAKHVQKAHLSSQNSLPWGNTLGQEIWWPLLGTWPSCCLSGLWPLILYHMGFLLHLQTTYIKKKNNFCISPSVCMVNAHNECVPECHVLLLHQEDTFPIQLRNRLHPDEKNNNLEIFHCGTDVDSYHNYQMNRCPVIIPALF